MIWIAPSEKDFATDTLEKRLWSAADQFRANSGLIFLRSAEVRFAKQRTPLESPLPLLAGRALAERAGVRGESYSGDPVNRAQLSPYPCTTLDHCQRLGTSPERRTILGRFLDFRERLHTEGLTNGFQWVDGSFLEDIEARDGRPPNDLDVVTVFTGDSRAGSLTADWERFFEVRAGLASNASSARTSRAGCRWR